MDDFLEDAMLSEIHYIVASVVETEANAYGGDNAITCDNSSESLITFGSLLC